MDFINDLSIYIVLKEEGVIRIALIGRLEKHRNTWSIVKNILKDHEKLNAKLYMYKFSFLSCKLEFSDHKKR